MATHIDVSFEEGLDRLRSLVVSDSGRLRGPDPDASPHRTLAWALRVIVNQQAEMKQLRHGSEFAQNLLANYTEDDPWTE